MTSLFHSQFSELTNSNIEKEFIRNAFSRLPSSYPKGLECFDLDALYPVLKKNNIFPESKPLYIGGEYDTLKEYISPNDKTVAAVNHELHLESHPKHTKLPKGLFLYDEYDPSNMPSHASKTVKESNVTYEHFGIPKNLPDVRVENPVAQAMSVNPLTGKMTKLTAKKYVAGIVSNDGDGDDDDGLGETKENAFKSFQEQFKDLKERKPDTTPFLNTDEPKTPPPPPKRGRGRPRKERQTDQEEELRIITKMLGKPKAGGGGVKIEPVITPNKFDALDDDDDDEGEGENIFSHKSQRKSKKEESRKQRDARKKMSSEKIKQATEFIEESQRKESAELIADSVKKSAKFQRIQNSLKTPTNSPPLTPRTARNQRISAALDNFMNFKPSNKSTKNLQDAPFIAGYSTKETNDEDDYKTPQTSRKRTDSISTKSSLSGSNRNRAESTSALSSLSGSNRNRAESTSTLSSLSGNNRNRAESTSTSSSGNRSRKRTDSASSNVSFGVSQIYDDAPEIAKNERLSVKQTQGNNDYVNALKKLGGNTKISPPVKGDPENIGYEDVYPQLNADTTETSPAPKGTLKPVKTTSKNDETKTDDRDITHDDGRSNKAEKEEVTEQHNMNAEQFLELKKSKIFKDYENVKGDVALKKADIEKIQKLCKENGIEPPVLGTRSTAVDLKYVKRRVTNEINSAFEKRNPKK